MDRTKLSKPEKKLLKVLHETSKGHGIRPSQRDLARILDISYGRVWQILEVLEAKGYIKREKGKHRRIEVVD